MKTILNLYTRTFGVSLALVIAVFLFADINPASAAPPFENKCNDGVDNDLDGLTDADDPDCDADNGGGGKTGNGQDTPVDVYLYHIDPYGILGDEWFTGGDAMLNPAGDATLYPANKTLSGDYSCASAIMTDQAQGYVRMFVPAGDATVCSDAPNRLLRMRTDYDLDQDGLCGTPYFGRQKSSGGFNQFYPCAGPEPDLLEDVMVTMHLNEVLGPGDSTPAGFQIRLLEYGDGYTPNPGYDPLPSDLTFIGSQERAFIITLQGATTSIPDPADPEVRIFENTLGNATICEVVWKNAHAKDCEPILENGEPVVIPGMSIKGKVDPTPLP